MQPGQQGTRSYRAFPARLLSELRNIERTVGLDDVGQPSVMNAGQETPLLWEQELGRLLSSFMGPRRGLREPCAYLKAGRRFKGWQQVRHGPKGEHWIVEVEITDYEPASGRLSGLLEAYSVPESDKPVTTFFEGEVVDNRNHSFLTSDWGAGAETDIRHWSRFKAFQPLRREVMACGGRHGGLARHRHLYMRWKELFFIEGCESRLTIAGFYYLCLDRVSGAIEGLYYDPSCAPDQHLMLQPTEKPAGFGFGFGDVERA
ncbi:hypothetical protein QBZ16_004740 [Prototheca wickerhamii]|uniref:Uncharacterized protein n=1 Tax=Prototheca wickerhamii TaxID=3111 RepID=A0AAD9IEX5_PROWI|nr:hypothetical protein QBZ16_004740 [Prototheca wickerhamii]